MTRVTHGAATTTTGPGEPVATGVRRQVERDSSSSSAELSTLTYLSTAVTPLDRGELVAFLEAWRRYNDAEDISGMLLYAGGHFIQTLEGPADAVQRLFARIAEDPRHRDVILTLHEPALERAFDGWSMGFEELDESESDRIPGFTQFLAAPEAEQRDAGRHGRAGVFHRVFRDRMR